MSCLREYLHHLNLKSGMSKLLKEVLIHIGIIIYAAIVAGIVYHKELAEWIQ